MDDNHHPVLITKNNSGLLTLTPLEDDFSSQLRDDFRSVLLMWLSPRSATLSDNTFDNLLVLINAVELGDYT